METIDIRTDFQKAKDELREKVADMFNELKEANPTAKDNRLYEIIGREFSMSRDAIRSICIRQGVTQPVRQ